MSMQKYHHVLHIVSGYDAVHERSSIQLIINVMLISELLIWTRIYNASTISKFGDKFQSLSYSGVIPNLVPGRRLNCSRMEGEVAIVELQENLEQGHDLPFWNYTSISLEGEELGRVEQNLGDCSNHEHIYTPK